MKYSKSAITQLSKWYKNILIKCAIANMAIFVGFAAVPARADFIFVSAWYSNIKDTNDEFLVQQGGELENSGIIRGNITNSGVFTNLQKGKVFSSNIEARTISFNLGEISMQGEKKLRVWEFFYNGLGKGDIIYGDAKLKADLYVHGPMMPEFVNMAKLEGNIYVGTGQIYNGGYYNNMNKNAEYTGNVEIYDGSTVANAGKWKGDINGLNATVWQNGTFEGNITMSKGGINLGDGITNGNILHRVTNITVNKITGDPVNPGDYNGNLEVVVWGNTSHVFNGKIEADTLLLHEDAKLQADVLEVKNVKFRNKSTLRIMKDSEAEIINLTEDKSVKDVRLELGTNMYSTGTFIAGESAVLALDVETPTKYGKLMFHEISIDTGAKLEITVNPGFSDDDKAYTVQLLEAYSNNVRDFNNFTDDFSKIDNNMFEIVRVNNDGAYSIKQIKKSGNIIEEENKPNGGNNN
ncbi:MAG: hypothetical protein ILA52_01055, partial [Alphaproteobacteria bacterium]|nr:hypothetical protein [Alphaproteobacteria bacterium]